MGLSTDTKLVVKHTFLEFVADKTVPNNLRARANTDTPSMYSTYASGVLGYEGCGNLTSTSRQVDLQDGHISAATPPCNVMYSNGQPWIQDDMMQQMMTANMEAQHYMMRTNLAVLPGSASVNYAAEVPYYEYLPMQGNVPQRATAMTPSVDLQAEGLLETRTSLLIRSLPQDLSRDGLIEQMNMMGLAGRYNFVYMPVDFNSGRTLHYAIVDMVSAADAGHIWSLFSGVSDESKASDEVCAVCWSDPHQGLDSHVERYRNSPVMHISIPDAWKPAVFERGQRVAFPHPTKKLKAPKTRSAKRH